MLQATSSLQLEAHAKVNLTLEILGKRADGYHELRSIVIPVTLTDTLTISASASQIAVSVSAEEGVELLRIGSVERNLVFRAARLLQTRYNVAHGARIHLHKRIPICAGLGGGSADAAAALAGLNRLWCLERPLDELLALGAELGSDVPALLLGGTVLMEGRGERVRHLLPASDYEAPEGFCLVLANPGIMCPTPEIFRKWRGGLTASPLLVHNMKSFIRTGDALMAAPMLYNDLQTVVYDHYPRIAALAAALKEAGALGVLLSGSGASVFGLAHDESHGHEICRRLPPGIWNAVVRTCPVV